MESTAGEPLQFELGALGRWTPGRSMTVGREQILTYSHATNDRAAIALGGGVAPPVFAIVPVWVSLQEAARSVAPEEARARVVHGDQDIRIAAPIRPGLTLRSRAAPIGVHVKDSGTTVVLKTETRDGDDRLLNEQFVTEFYRGVTGGTGDGLEAPGHRMPEEVAQSEPDRQITYPVDEDQTFRYAEASGDRNAFHLDDDAARAAGLPGIIVHGLCLMAFAGRAVLEFQQQENPAAVRRLAVRFARPVSPGAALTTRVHKLDEDAVAFDAVDGEGAVVLKDGLVELREPGPSR
jgi:acyl dehydratase